MRVYLIQYTTCVYLEAFEDIAMMAMAMVLKIIICPSSDEADSKCWAWKPITALMFGIGLFSMGTETVVTLIVGSLEECE